MQLTGSPASPEQASDPSSATLATSATIAAALAVIAVFIWHVGATLARPDARWVLPDLNVYRLAVAAALSGQSVYAGGFGATSLPWLYPPFALLALAPLSWLPATGAKIVMSLLSLAALAVLCARSWRATGVAQRWRAPLTLAAFAALLASEPMQQNLAMGQVNVVLAALVLADVLLPSGHRAKGVLVGLAAGIKLTPALVALYYLLRRDWAAAGRAGATFAATVLLGSLAFGSDSWTYWTQAAFASRIGPAHLGNQSLLGVALRLAALTGVDEQTARLVWLVLALAIALAGVWLVSRLHLDALGSYCALAAVTLVVSPLSWTPHWITLTPMVIWLAARARTVAGTYARLVALGLAIFAWPVEGVWSGLVWLVYPADYWAGAPALVRAIGWVACGSLYLMFAVASLGLLFRAGRACVPDRAGAVAQAGRRSACAEEA